MSKILRYALGFAIVFGIVFFIGGRVWAGSSLQEPDSAPAQTEACGETGAWNVLILGSDYAEMGGQKGSDLTRMLRVDFSNKRVIVFNFPRDLWVDTAGLGLTHPNIEATRLGMVFYEGRIRSLQFSETDTVVDGARATARMLSKNFSLSTDHYLSLDINHLAEMVDAVGGLPVNIPARITDPLSGLVVEAGQKTLSGAQVVAYARAIPDSDSARSSRQDLIAAALSKKLLEPSVMAQISELYTRFEKVIVTDLSVEQINHLSCLLEEVTESSILQEGIKPEWTSAGPQGSLLWDEASVLTRLKELDMIP